MKRGDPHRPPSRFNRPRQDALYLSPDETSARVAIGQYVTEANQERVLLTFEVRTANLLDLRHPEAIGLYEDARQSWIPVLEAGGEPPSWRAADRIRAMGFDGLIDPSRRRPGLWHVTLFRWNRPGAPTVRQIGAPKPLLLEIGFR
ncbi:RES domain-containing protein [Roseibium sp. RKSG952]|nr:RES domain-containing protein [Roseibium sp. RKSG952]